MNIRGLCLSCPNRHTTMIIKGLDRLFSLIGMPCSMHSDRGVSFMSKELRDYLVQKGVMISKTMPYHPTGNTQVEWFNGTIWKMIQLSVGARNLTEKYLELVLPEVLQSDRSLLCTSTNTTPHKHFFSFSRHSSHSISLPSLLMSPGLMLFKGFIRNNKTNPYVDQVELLNNLTYANIKYPSRRESTVSVRDLTPCPETELPLESSTMELNKSPPVVPIQGEDNV